MWHQGRRRDDGDAGNSSWQLDWIPRRLKQNVKLVLSVSNEDLLDALKRDVLCAINNYVEVMYRYRSVWWFVRLFSRIVQKVVK